MTAVGDGVRDIKVGDRVAWTSVQGAYADLLRGAGRPPRCSAFRRHHAKQGAAVMLQGMTAHYLACSTYPLKSGDTCLIHAGAGGVGCYSHRSRSCVARGS